MAEGRLTDEELEKRAGAKKGKASPRTSTATAHVRDEYVAEYARRRADGRCDLCAEEAPFEDKHGNPYLECHHVVWLARGGDDAIDNTVALCPNCHRRMHILNRADDVAHLRKAASKKLSPSRARTKRQAAEAGRTAIDE